MAVSCEVEVREEVSIHTQNIRIFTVIFSGIVVRSVIPGNGGEEPVHAFPGAFGGGAAIDPRRVLIFPGLFSTISQTAARDPVRSGCVSGFFSGRRYEDSWQYQTHRRYFLHSGYA